MTAKRKPISKKLRFEVFKRDAFVCQYCGSHPPSAILHVDHIIPVVEGGLNNIDNLVTACDVCNMGKGRHSLKDIPASLKDRATDVEEKEAQILGYAKVMDAKRDRVENDAWRVAELFMSQHRMTDIKNDWFISIRRFNESLGVHECLDAMEYACDRVRTKDGCFRYFCSICWGKIREAEA